MSFGSAPIAATPISSNRLTVLVPISFGAAPFGATPIGSNNLTVLVSSAMSAAGAALVATVGAPKNAYISSGN